MGKIRTVTGEIDAVELGFTSVHDHLLVDSKDMQKIMMASIPGMTQGAGYYHGAKDIMQEMARRKAEGILIPQDTLSSALGGEKSPQEIEAEKVPAEEFIRRELAAYREAGGRSICDCTPNLSIPLSYATLQRYAEETGVQVIAAAGYYTEPSIPDGLSEKQMEENISRLIQEGDGSCDARPGLIKCALSMLTPEGRIAEKELASITAAARCAKEAGLSLHIHCAFPARKEHVLQVADLLEKDIRIDPDQVVFCHQDSFNLAGSNPAAVVNRDGVDLSLPRELAKRNFHVGIDTWGLSTDSPDENPIVKTRTALLLDLLNEGYGSRITLGHDGIMNRMRGASNGGYGFTFLPRYLEALVEQGILTEDTKKLLTITNPAVLLTVRR